MPTALRVQLELEDQDRDKSYIRVDEAGREESAKLEAPANNSQRDGGS